MTKQISKELDPKCNPELDQAIKKAIDEATFMDPWFAQMVLDHCTDQERNEIAQGILRPIVGKDDLTIISTKTKRLLGDGYDALTAPIEFFAEDQNHNHYHIVWPFSGR
ncbi:hypothetical protein IM774_00055 [Erysipelotrichaceae bacterium RD49]|nr:hypothetical protein [Erysipelotrichaceae bacterium RD49]